MAFSCPEEKSYQKQLNALRPWVKWRHYGLMTVHLTINSLNKPDRRRTNIF
jgi:hypothetical protein